MTAVIVKISIDEPLLALLDGWRNEQPVPPARAAAARFLLRRALGDDTAASRDDGWSATAAAAAGLTAQDMVDIAARAEQEGVSRGVWCHKIAGEFARLSRMGQPAEPHGVS